MLCAALFGFNSDAGDIVPNVATGDSHGGLKLWKPNQREPLTVLKEASSASKNWVTVTSVAVRNGAQTLVAAVEIDKKEKDYAVEIQVWKPLQD